MVLSKNELSNQLVKDIAASLLLALIIIFSITLRTLQVTRRFIFNPLKKLENSTSLIADGNLDTEIDVSSKDEIGDLANNFNVMQKSIKNLIEKLKAANLHLEEKVVERTLELAQSEKSLKNHVAFNDALVDFIPYPLFVKGSDARFTTFNKAYEKAFGIRAKDYIGKTVLDLDYLPKEARDFTQAEDLEFLQTGGRKNKELDIQFADGKFHSVLYSITSFDLSDGVVGGLLGIMVDISTLKRLERDLAQANKRMGSELNIAREIQMSMLPLKFPAYPNHKEFEVYARLKPAREVGGDFYDFFFIDNKRFCFCVGDVSGKGAPAALFMAVTKTLIKARAMEDFSPASILTHVNSELSYDNPSCMFVTIFICILDLESGELVYTNAGHNPPYIKRDKGDLESVDQRHGPVMGAVDGMTYKEDKTFLSKGDFFVLYTDGVTEAMDSGNNLFSDERLADLLSSKKYDTAQNIVETTVDTVGRFEGEAHQADDITVLGFKFNGPLEKAEVDKRALTLKNKMAEIDRINKEFSEFSAQNGISTNICRKFNLAFDEILNNIITYAYQNEEEHVIEVKLELLKNRLTATIEDDGVPFNPLMFKAPSTDLPLEEREVGGMGIHLVRNVMDKFYYQRRIDKNIVTLVKHLNS